MKRAEKKYLLEKIEEYIDVMQSHKSSSIRLIRGYERKWKYLKQRYDKVCIYGVQFVSIGETIPRLFMYMKDKKKRSKNDFHVVLPTFFQGYYIGGIVNTKIFDIYKKCIYFITDKNVDFWKYVIIFHSDKINIENFDSYKYRDISVTFNIEVGKPLIPFSNEIERYAREKMRRMGIRGEYICIHAREVATKTKNFISTYDDTSVVDANINSYGQACDYMRHLGYQAVRIGKDENRVCEIKDVIDYANNFYDELMDFYLLANCKFIIGGMAGIVAVASFWGRPILQVDTLSFCYGQESLPRTEYDLYIPKKFYSRREKRYLNLYETWDISFKCDRYNERFKKEGIEIIDNTEEEIFQATVEMNDKLNHTWKQTEEEKQCMEKYWRIIELWKNKHKLTYVSKKQGGMGKDNISRPICYSYLKENLYLLDVKELYEKS